MRLRAAFCVGLRGCNADACNASSLHRLCEHPGGNHDAQGDELARTRALARRVLCCHRVICTPREDTQPLPRRSFGACNLASRTTPSLRPPTPPWRSTQAGAACATCCSRTSATPMPWDEDDGAPPGHAPHGAGRGRREVWADSADHPRRFPTVPYCDRIATWPGCAPCAAAGAWQRLERNGVCCSRTRECSGVVLPRERCT